MKTVLEQLKKDTYKILSLSQNEMMHMLLQSWELLQIDNQREFKSLFVFGNLYALAGAKMVKFTKELMTSQPTESQSKTNTTHRRQTKRKL